MAPTSARRSGHSRRAQYGLFTGYVLAAIGAAVGAVLLGISLWRPTSFNGVRAAAADTVVPVSVKVIVSNEANAGSLPGGFVYVTTGLIRAAATEAELAAAIAFEIAHLAARHATELPLLTVPFTMPLRSCECRRTWRKYWGYWRWPG